MEIIKLLVGGQEVDARQCSSCHVVKPLTDFNKSSKSTCGHCAECKECRRQRYGYKTRAVKVEITKVVIGTVEIDAKQCTKCDSIKPLADFSIEKRGTGGRRSACKACENPMLSQYRRKNRDEVLERSRKWREQYPDKQRESARKWRISNRERESMYNKRKRIRRMSLPITISYDDWQFILSDFDYVCALSKTGENVVAEHFIAISTGHGGTHKGNVYPLNQKLNGSKWNRNPFDWVSSRQDIDSGRFESLVAYLADKNSLSIAEYRHLVNWCYDNKRTVDEVKRDPRPSIDIWREQTGKGRLFS